MVYHTLDELIYRNSRYEFIQLLEDISPTRHGKVATISDFDKVAEGYEQLLNKYFPTLPLSEERLAIFSRIYSDAGFISESLIKAVESGIRAIVVSVLKDARVNSDAVNTKLQRRRFYEAELFNAG